MIVTKFSTLAGGVFIEVNDREEYTNATRCFRFDEDGNAEWAPYGELVSGNPVPRWYAHQYKAKDFVLC